MALGRITKGLAMAVTKKKPRIFLQVDIIAPDEELAKSGECYATLRREIELSFVPFIGLHLMLEPQVTDQQESRFSELFDFIESKTMIFEVENILYQIDREDFVLSARNQFEPTLEQFHALQGVSD